MKTLIVPTDFSSSSVNAAKYAADMAVAIHADVHVLHVMELPVANAEFPLTEQLFTEIKQDAEEQLQKLKTELQTATGGKVNILTLLEMGSVEHQLEEFCKRINPFAVIMGIKKNSMEQFFFGSNTLFAAKHLHYPLLAIPQNARFHAIRKIVLACDLTHSIENIPLDYLKELQQLFNSVLSVISVNTKNIDSLYSGSEFTSLNNLLHDLYPTYYFSVANSVEEGINKFIAENNPDLLLLLPKYHRFLEFHKSDTQKLILQVDMPVMAIHE